MAHICASAVSKYSADSAQCAAQTTLSDVYTLATEIGAELQSLISRCGSEVVSRLVPGVINALERLEHSVVCAQRDRQRVCELEESVETLRRDTERAFTRNSRYDIQNLLEIDSLRDEEGMEQSNDLLTADSRLPKSVQPVQTSPVTTRTSLALQLDTVSIQTDDPDDQLSCSQQQTIAHLRTIISRQSAELLIKQKHILDRNDYIDQLQQKLDRVYTRARSQCAHYRRSAERLEQQRTALESELSRLRCLLSSADRKMSLMGQQQQEMVHSSCRQSGVFLSPPHTLTAAHTAAEFDIHSVSEHVLVTPPSNDSLPLSVYGGAHSEEWDSIYSSELSSPRSLLAELQNSNSMCSHTADRPVTTHHQDCDAPVEGPLPREPDDVPWRNRARKPSIIKYFFKWLLPKPSQHHQGSLRVDRATIADSVIQSANSSAIFPRSKSSTLLTASSSALSALDDCTSI